MAEYLQVQTPASPSGDIGCAPDNAGCSVGDAYLAYLEEEKEEEDESESESEEERARIGRREPKVESGGVKKEEGSLLYHRL